MIAGVLGPAAAPWDAGKILDRVAATVNNELMPPGRRTVLIATAALTGAALTVELEPLQWPVTYAAGGPGAGSPLTRSSPPSTSPNGHVPGSGTDQRSPVVRWPSSSLLNDYWQEAAPFAEVPAVREIRHVINDLITA